MGSTASLERDAVRRLIAAGVSESFAAALHSTGDRCAEIVIRHRDSLTPDDIADLIRAYFRAESLAHYAIEQAIEQTRSEERRSALREQLADEARHMALFSDWLGDGGEVEAARPKRRPEAVWHTLLLVNEITGYCQFRLLGALLDAPRLAQLDAVLREEEVHIGRLAQWLRPVWTAKAGVVSERIVERFATELPGRMCQFFPRRSLDALRDELVVPIGEAVRLARTA